MEKNVDTLCFTNIKKNNLLPPQEIGTGTQILRNETCKAPHPLINGSTTTIENLHFIYIQRTHDGLRKGINIYF